MIQNSILKSFFTLMSGSVIAQLIPILISPFITRLYTSSEFGEFALFTAVLSICSSLVNAKYSSAILLPKDKSDFNSLVLLNIFFSILFSFCLFILIFLNIKFDFYSLELKSIYQLIIPFLVLIFSINQVYLMLANRSEKYKQIALAKTFQSSLNSASSLMMGYLNYGVFGLVLSKLLAFSISTLYLSFTISLKLYRKYLSYKSIKRIALKYFDFPLYTLPQTLLYQLVIQIPIFFIQDVYSIYFLGLYALTSRVLTVPTSIISSSISQIYYKQATDFFNNGRKLSLHIITRKFIFQLFLISITISLFVYPFLPELFSFIFGNDWKQAGVISQYLLLYLVPAFVISPFTQIFLVSKNNKFLFIVEIIRFTLLILLYILGKVFSINMFDFLIYFSSIHCLFYIILSIPILNIKSFVWR